MFPHKAFDRSRVYYSKDGKAPKMIGKMLEKTENAVVRKSTEMWLKGCRDHKFIKIKPQGFRITPQFMKYEIANNTLNKITGEKGLRDYEEHCKTNGLKIEDP